jgi:hypothetical protein
MRKQKCILWATTGRDEYNRPTWTTPVEISCRWEDKIVEFLAPDGSRQLSNAIVYVDRDIELGSVLKLGALTSGIVEATPFDNDDVFEVRSFDKLPNLKATEFLRTVLL